MRFLLDANLPRAAIEAVRSAGHSVEFARDIGLADADDETIAAYARKTKAALVTRDLDFADVRRHPPEIHFGLVVLRLPEDAVATDIAETIRRFVASTEFVTSLAGRLAIIEPGRARFRPPLNE